MKSAPFGSVTTTNPERVPTASQWSWLATHETESRVKMSPSAPPKRSYSRIGSTSAAIAPLRGRIRPSSSGKGRET
eukprot:scaffold1154_cov310-Pinguiococcus_pyrenoidosus.AAC.14